MDSLPLQPFDTLSRVEIAAVLDNLSRASVAVLGDFCLDVYWTVDSAASEISVETGLRTQPVRQQRYSPGGAGNVVMNLLALGVHRIFPIGVLGDDPFGRELRRQLESVYIDSTGLITQTENWATHTYVKPYLEGRETNRIDLGNYNQLASQTEAEFFRQLSRILNEVSVVLINHQSIGSIHDSKPFRHKLGDLIRTHPKVAFIVDSRGYHEDYSMAIHKLNDREVLRSNEASLAPDEPISLELLTKNAGQLQARWKAPLVVTRGERGCLVYSNRVVEQVFGVQLPGRADPVGAGDTFVATLAATLSTGTNLAAAAYTANLAAAVTAQKLCQTGTATPSEILKLGSHVNFAYHPELAESPRQAKYYSDSEIEVVAESPAHLDIRHAIFDHDGTISTLREGWEQIMEPMMLKAVLGNHFGDVEEAVYNRLRAQTREFIERTTGIQTIEQMHGLVSFVRECGFVPETEIRTPTEYKATYNEELKALVARRLAKLDHGELEVADFTLKGAVPFLEALSKAGVRLYLASGTDQEDVKAEAERLGYASLFDGGIFGSVGEIDKDAKRIVIERIMQEVNGAREQVAAFGDGPVEMREIVRQGSYGVGVASDEMRRFGSNPGKRCRLIRAGAHLIVPDFSQWETLWTVLHLPKR